jgi:cell wall-associated NlpC family hydrolase
MVANMITFWQAHPIRQILRIGIVASALFVCAASWAEDSDSSIQEQRFLNLTSSTNLTSPRQTNLNPAPASQASPPDSPRTTFKKISNRASELAMQAMGMLGYRYKLGGTTPENGMDCSGMVQHVFKQAWGAILPRSAAQISQIGQKVKPKDMQPGDLVFYNTLRRGFSHVGIYLGDNKFIHSPSAGGHVRIESMDITYWKKRFNGARRIEDPAAVKVVATVATPQL